MGPSGEKSHFFVLEATVGLSSHPPTHLTSAWTGQHERCASFSHRKCTEAFFSSTTVFWYKSCRRKIIALFFGGTSHLLLLLLLGHHSLSISISHLVAFPLYSLTLLLHLWPLHLPSFQQDKMYSACLSFGRSKRISDPQQISPSGNGKVPLRDLHY